MTSVDENIKSSKRRLPGRPKKGIKRSEILMVRLTPTERLLIEDKSKKAGMNPSEWSDQPKMLRSFLVFQSRRPDG